MTMISDSERREVARKLREVNPYRNQSYMIPCNRYTPAVEYLSELAGALGYSPKNDVSRLEFQNRLADLIEPTAKCEHGGQLYEIGADLAEKQGKGVLVLHGDQGVPDVIECDGRLYERIDRDALLELADEVSQMAEEAGRADFANAGMCFMGISDRMRTALGVGA